MKQKVSVYALIKQEQKVLMLRRALGRESLIGKYELPGGELLPNMQPQLTAEVLLQEQLGVAPTVVQLFDVDAYQSAYDTQTQRVDIVYLAALPGGANFTLSARHSKFAWKSMRDLQRNEVTESTLHLLLKNEHPDLLLGRKSENLNNVVIPSTVPTAIIYTDGGSRGNPGPSASGFVILDEAEHLIEEGGEYLGIATNNQAEYHAVRLALEAASKRGVQVAHFRIDSLLVVNQLTGIYKIKNRDLWPVHQRIKDLVGDFKQVTFTHVRREFNQEADAMVNKILDEHRA